MIKVIRYCDFCGEELPKPKNINELLESKTKEWNMKAFDICDNCALKLDNEMLRMKLQYQLELKLNKN